jgi:queuine tRNA-ribosyltransferase
VTRFSLLKVDSRTGARLGRILTARGQVETPAFMPVGTQGSVKGLTPDDLRSLGVQLVLANTYHLYLRPGVSVIRELGGLHSFMGWDGPLLTDSGGFQVHSLAALRKVTEEGVIFRSHLDGSEHLMTPELAIEIQQGLGVDIIHAFDECLGYPATHEAARASMELTLRWARRSLAAHRAGALDHQACFGIIQGGGYEDLRMSCVEALGGLGFDGFAIGGLAVGEPKSLMYDLTEYTASLLPQDRPRYLMGVGKPQDLVEAVSRGVDLFDCVLPTRNARTGSLFTSEGVLAIRNARYARDNRSVDPSCPCYACARFSRAYLRHLFMAEELLAYRLATFHNLHFYMTLMARIREAIREDHYGEFRKEFIDRYGSLEELALSTQEESS